MVKEEKPEIEYVRIYGATVDKYGVLAESQVIRLEGANIQPVYNSSNFDFTVEKMPLLLIPFIRKWLTRQLPE